ncbi:MAG TPA: class I SAM-dependent methyltransferase [Gaiellaceae bacterium]
MSEKAQRFAALQSARAAELEASIARLVTLRGDERALDVGTGAGALAFALAPHVREVVAVDSDAAMLAQARTSAPANVELVEAGAEQLPFDDASFDFVGTLRTLHHVRRPELAVAELTRVARPGAVVFVVDQIAPVDPLAALDLNRFERARDPSTSRVLSDGDLRALFDANGLVLRRSEFDHEQRDLDAYLDLAGCEGEPREQAKTLAPRGYTAVLGWYVLERR